MKHCAEVGDVRAQYCPAAQRAPQAPQFSTSVPTLTQAEPESPRGQLVRGAGHASEQRPDAHTRPVVQGRLHPPQCDALLKVLTQRPPHGDWPAGHPEGAAHTPAAQL